MKFKLRNFFGVYNEGQRKVLCILGIKIKLKKRAKEHSKKISEKYLKQLLGNPQVVAVLTSYTIPSINRDEIASLAENLNRKGINQESGRKHEVIVSLTSYPKRMYDIHLCLYSLLVQDFKPDRLILWLANEQFPNGEDDIPRRVLDLKQWGLEIRWCEDTRSYKKLIPALEAFPDSVIVTADDDIYYPHDWLLNLWNTHCEQPDSIIAHRCRKIYLSDNEVGSYHSWTLQKGEQAPSYLNFMTGAGGVLYPPKSLHKNVSDKSAFLKLCPNGDDIWFWCMAVLQGSRIAVPRNPFHNLVYINPLREANALDDGTLFSVNQGAGNDAQIATILDTYPDLKSMLINDASRFVAVSIIIPVYNAEKYLPRCLKSVLHQKLQNIEVICVNDGSTDRSLEILNEWASKYKNLRIINQANAGSAAARNVGIREAQGEYIGMVDADDEISPDYFKCLYQAACSSGSDVAATSKIIICHQNGKKQLKNTGISPQQSSITSIEERGQLVIATGVTWNKIYRRSLLHRHSIFYPEVRCAGEDNYFCAMTAVHANRIEVTHQAEYLYYMNDMSQTHVNKSRKDFHIIKFYEDIEKGILALPMPIPEKKKWLEIINKRKAADYKVFYNSMLPEYKEEFKALSDMHLNIKYLD